jgi:hypothetical protein
VRLFIEVGDRIPVEKEHRHRQIRLGRSAVWRSLERELKIGRFAVIFTLV